jgi:uncharacterized protein (TIGR02246 family)
MGQIAELLERFVEGFNVNDLDSVMTFFADNAVYLPGNGDEFRGRAAIRKAFLPQFSNTYGAMQFLVDDRVVDETARKAAIRWVCKHDFDQTRPAAMRWLMKARYGSRAGWYGTDIFHFDQEGKIVGKFSYANYGPRPQLRRDLG